MHVISVLGFSKIATYGAIECLCFAPLDDTVMQIQNFEFGGHIQAQEFF